MTMIPRGIVAVTVVVASQMAAATNVVNGDDADYRHTGRKYPPVFFVTNIDDGGFGKTLDAYGAFSRIDDKAVGLPIGVRVLQGYRTKEDGTRFSTAMLSAATLGLTPVVSNTEFKVRYEVFVQGTPIATYQYQSDSMDVENMWTSSNNERETKPSEEQFINNTIPRFLNELKDSDKVQAVFREYWEYFGTDMSY